MNYSILEAIIQIKKGPGLSVKEDDAIKLVEEVRFSPEVRTFNLDAEEVVKFSFVIHPLSSSYLFKHPYLKFMRKYSKPIEKLTEEAITLSPGFFYGKIQGIVSEKNGRKVEGLIYTITETPKKMMQAECQCHLQ